MMIGIGLQAALGHLVTTLPWVVLGATMFMNYLRVQKRTVYLLIFAYGVVDAAAIFFLRGFVASFTLYQPIVMALINLLLLALFLCCFRVFPGKLAYVFLLINALSNMAYHVAYIACLHIYGTGGVPIGLGTTPAYALISMGVEALVIPLVWFFFRPWLLKAFEELPNRDILILCVPPALFWLISTFVSSIYNQAAYTSIQTALLLLLIMLTGIVVYYVNLKTVMESAGRSRLEAENAAMERQLTLQAQNYEQLTEGIEKAKAVRHDLRHHLSVLSGYAGKNDLPALSAYLESYASSLPLDSAAAITKNSAVDVTVRHYLDKLTDQTADIDVKIDLPTQTGIADTDLCIIFGNLFENAVLALLRMQEGQRRLRSRCNMDMGKIIITVDNTCNPAECQTLKPSIGISSIISVAQKYGGSARFAYTDGGFESGVILYLPTAS